MCVELCLKYFSFTGRRSPRAAAVPAADAKVPPYFIMMPLETVDIMGDGKPPFNKRPWGKYSLVGNELVPKQQRGSWGKGNLA
jgi:hypothetical protein